MLVYVQITNFIHQNYEQFFFVNNSISFNLEQCRLQLLWNNSDGIDDKYMTAQEILTI